MTSPHTRAPWLDAIKLLAAQIIVWHHLCAYGPLADAAALIWPDAAALLYNKGRLAVQVFLVLAGYLAAQGLSRVSDWHGAACAALAIKRYRRLVWPLCAALVLTAAAAAATRDLLPGHMVPASPDVLQVAAHVLLMQNVLGMAPLSAGIWYVAIDFQLFVLLLLFFALPALLTRTHKRATQTTVALTVALMLTSLWCLNLRPVLDNWAPYFFGSYGLGVCAYWAGRSPHRQVWCLCLVVAVALALMIDFRGRILLAGLTAGVVVFGGELAPGTATTSQYRAWCLEALHAGAQRAYALFLVHFPVLLLANGLWVVLEQRLNFHPNAVGTAAALFLTWLAAWGLAHGFYAAVEAAPAAPPARQSGQ